MPVQKCTVHTHHRPGPLPMDSGFWRQNSLKTAVHSTPFEPTSVYSISHFFHFFPFSASFVSDKWPHPLHRPLLAIQVMLWAKTVSADGVQWNVEGMKCSHWTLHESHSVEWQFVASCPFHIYCNVRWDGHCGDTPIPFHIDSIQRSMVIVAE